MFYILTLCLILIYLCFDRTQTENIGSVNSPWHLKEVNPEIKECQLLKYSKQVFKGVL